MFKNESKSYTLVIYSGRNSEEFSKKMLDATIKGLEARNRKYKIIDLYKDNFDPIYRSKDLALYSKGKTTDKHALKYQDMVKKANELMFVYPTVWNGMDVMTKGFCDKVFLSNGFWKIKKVIYFTALWGTMGWIKRVNVFTTQTVKTKSSRNSGKLQIMMGTLFALKTKSRKFLNLSKREARTKFEKSEFLEKITKRSSKKL